MRYIDVTRSQAVARIADIDRPFPLEPSHYLLTVSNILGLNGECDAMVGMILIRPLNKVESISHIRLPIGCQ